MWVGLHALFNSELIKNPENIIDTGFVVNSLKKGKIQRLVRARWFITYLLSGEYVRAHD